MLEQYNVVTDPLLNQWINDVGKHFLGAPFGGVKQSGIGREECLEEMLAFTQEKNIHVKLKPAKG